MMMPSARDQDRDYGAGKPGGQNQVCEAETLKQTQSRKIIRLSMKASMEIREQSKKCTTNHALTPHNHLC